MSEFCPLCLSKGQKTVLKYFQINLSETTRMCADAKVSVSMTLCIRTNWVGATPTISTEDENFKFLPRGLSGVSLAATMPYQI